MAICEVCSNEYNKPIEITMAGSQHTFDSFECAIHALAPVCNHCGVPDYRPRCGDGTGSHVLLRELCETRKPFNRPQPGVLKPRR